MIDRLHLETAACTAAATLLHAAAAHTQPPDSARGRCWAGTMGCLGTPERLQPPAEWPAGDRRGTLDLLRRLVFQERSIRRRGLWDLPALQPLRDHPEFREIAGRRTCRD